MSGDTYIWIRIAHIIGDVAWVAGLVSVFALLRAHHGADAASRPGLVSAARAMALLMDLGATLAIGLGLWLAFASPRFPTNAFGSGGWFHIKMTLVVLGLLSAHGLMRAKLGKLRRGQPAEVPTWVLPLVLAAAAIIIVLAAHPTLLRK